MDPPVLPADLQLMELLQAHLEQQRQLHQQAQPSQQGQQQHGVYMDTQEQEDEEMEAIPVKKPQTSQYTGVVWNATSRRFRAAIKHEGKKVFLGNFTDEAEAARAFDRAAITLRGPDTRTNFPVDTYGDVESLVAEGVQGLPPARPVGRPRKHPLPDPSSGARKGRKRREREVIEIDGVEFDNVGAMEKALEASLPPCKKVAGLYYIPPEAAVNNPALDAVRRAIDNALSAAPPKALLQGGAPVTPCAAGASRSASTSLGAADTGVKREASLPLPPGFQLPKRKIGRPSNAERAARAAMEAAAAVAYAAGNATSDQQASSMPASLNALLLAASAADAAVSSEAAVTVQRAANLLQSVGPSNSLPNLVLTGPSLAEAAAATAATAPATTVPVVAAAVAPEAAPGAEEAEGDAAEHAPEREVAGGSEDELSSGSEGLQPPEPGSATQVQHKRRSFRALKQLPPGYHDVQEMPRYKGVSWQTDKQKWRVCLSQPQTKREHIGYFEDPEEAARAYDRAALQSFGAGTTTNFPLSDYLSPAQLATAAAAGQLPDTLQLPPKKRGRPPKLNVRQNAPAAKAGTSEPEAAAATNVLGALTAAKPASSAGHASAAAKGEAPSASAIAARHAAAAAEAAAQRQAASLAATGAAQISGDAAAAQYEGVTYVAERNMYSASIEDPADKQRTNELGLFGSAEEAARAYDRALVRLQGAAARTNFGLDQYIDAVNAHLLVNVASLPQPLYTAPLVTPTSGGAEGVQLADMFTREQAERIRKTIQLTQATLLLQEQQKQQHAQEQQQGQEQDEGGVAAGSAAADVQMAAAAAAAGVSTAGAGAVTPGRARARKTPPATTPGSAAAAALKRSLSPPPVVLQLSALQQMAANLVPISSVPDGGAHAGEAIISAGASPAPNPMASAIPLSASAAAALLPQAALAASSSALAGAPPSLFMVLPQGVQLPQSFFP